jgi:hypothetical protein
MVLRNVSTSFTIEQQRVEINELAGDVNNIATGATSVGTASGLAAGATGADLTLSGTLTVNGTQTILNTATLEVEDKNIVIAKGSTTDAAANTGGITLKGADDKTITYSSTGDKWVSNKDFEAPNFIGSVAASQLTGDITSTGDLTINTDAFFVDASAKEVGIGTVYPTQKLDVRGNVYIGDDLQTDGAATFAGLMKSGSAQVEVASTSTNNLYGGNSYFGGTGDSSGNANASILNTGAATFTSAIINSDEYGGAENSIKCVRSGTNQVLLGSTGSGDVTIYMDADNGDFSGGQYCKLIAYNGGDLALENWMTGGDLLFKTSNSTRLTIDSAGIATFAGDLTVTGTSIFKGGLAEKYSSISGNLASNTNHSIFNGNVIAFAVGDTNTSLTINFTDVHATLSQYEFCSFTVILDPGGAGKITTVQIDGQSPAGGLKWSGGSAPSAGASGYDVYTFALQKYGTAANNYVVYGAATNYD